MLAGKFAHWWLMRSAVAIEWTIDSQITAAVPQSAGQTGPAIRDGPVEFRGGKNRQLSRSIWISVRSSCNSACRRKVFTGLCPKKLARTLASADGDAAFDI